MKEDDIAVEKRISAVGKLGFAVEKWEFAVAGDLKTVDFLGIAVGKGVWRWRNVVAQWGKIAALKEKMMARWGF